MFLEGHTAGRVRENVTNSARKHVNFCELCSFTAAHVRRWRPKTDSTAALDDQPWLTVVCFVVAQCTLIAVRLFRLLLVLDLLKKHNVRTFHKEISTRIDGLYLLNIALSAIGLTR